MIRLCDGADDFSRDESGMPCRCGHRYDDVDRSTRWPHDELPPAGPVYVRVGAELREAGRA